MNCFLEQSLDLNIGASFQCPQVTSLTSYRGANSRKRIDDLLEYCINSEHSHICTPTLFTNAAQGHETQL